MMGVITTFAMIKFHGGICADATNRNFNENCSVAAFVVAGWDCGDSFN